MTTFPPAASAPLRPLRPWPESHGRAVAVLGLGRTGRAAANLLAALGETPVLLDSGQGADLMQSAEELRARGCLCYLGKDALGRAGDFAWGVISPGIDPAAPLVRQFTDRNIPLLAEIEIAWRCCGVPIVAITGTNGKTTTTELLSHLLTSLGYNAPACGNIGLPFSTALQQHPTADFFVVEVSSFQLEICSTFAPAVAVWTNFSPNHLDRYRDVDEYFAAKARIFQAQTPRETAVVQLGSRLPHPLLARTLTFSATQPGADFALRDGVLFAQGKPLLSQATTHLPGPHNAENLLAAFAALVGLGLDPFAAVSAAQSYRPPAHRCEPVAEIGGLLFINDSKSTNLDALEKAIRGQTRPIILIAGGKDKGFTYAPLAPLAQERLTHAVLIGQMRERIAADWPGVPTSLADDLPSAVARAMQVAPPGAVILFSPGTSSFDMFRDYEHRGEAFRAAVLALARPHPDSLPQNKTKTTTPP